MWPGSNTMLRILQEDRLRELERAQRTKRRRRRWPAPRSALGPGGKASRCRGVAAASGTAGMRRWGTLRFTVAVAGDVQARSIDLDDVGEPTLVLAVRKGDERAFASLVAAHRRALHAHRYRTLASSEGADDAVQDALARTRRSIRRCQP